MAISSLSAIAGVPAVLSPPVKLERLQGGLLKNCNCQLAGLGKLSLDLNHKQNNTAQTSAFGKPSLNLHGKEVLTHSVRVHSASLICASALNARCGAEGQTQTVEKPVSVITNAPVHGKEKSPQLDDGGAGFPPRDDDGGGGGGGGGGGWAGGFFFFGFLAFLGLLNERDSDGSYERRRRK